MTESQTRVAVQHFMVSRTVFALLLAALAVCAYAADDAPLRTVDLRDPAALELLRQANPAHYEKIQRVVVGLREAPELAEGDWLEVSFDARDVDLSRYLIKTSYPPKQLLRFTLDDVRYVIHVVRGDLAATVERLR